MIIKFRASKFIDGLTLDAQRPNEKPVKSQDVQIDVYYDPYVNPASNFSVPKSELPGVELGDEFELRKIKRR